MRPIALLTFATAALLGLAAARAEASPSDSCLAECNAPGLSADDQATCRLQCARLAQSSTPATQPAAPRPAASPAPAPRPAQPASQPSAAPRPAASPAPAPRPAQPAPDLAHKKYLCESQCDAEPNPGDRSTCRLQCAQLYRASAAPPSASAPVSSHASGATTTYSFAPGGGYAPAPSTPAGGGYAHPAPASAPAHNPQAYQQQQQIAACQATCDREASPTDRATCRNNCGAVGTVVGPAAPSQWVLGPAPAMSEAEQRAAVIRSSAGVVSGASSAPRPAPPAGQATPPPATIPGAQQPPNPHCAAQAQSCKVGCASEQTSCSAQCDQGKMSETDRATCKLTCTTVGDSCRDDCRMKEAACKPPVYR